ncbi:hypothetical protein BCT94_03445 [Vibrio breoganii]|nr:hypothetical protein BCV08_02990 [Vibrio breoganii]PMH18431.1 hypothetical protein BCU74_08815 [Vibrio breoganii]PMK60674.1 hypothetical protein BCT98_05765 [Vibrio breoganii]PMK66517.1 hypothetical protein BCT94_03445 [Vibrio breoganii]PML58010.1 hypothetical protein BCT73_11765 [Vibrio breoganii]
MDMNRTSLSSIVTTGLFTAFFSTSSQAFECPAGAPNICAPATVIDNTVPRLLSTVSPGDAPIILRTTTMITAAWFDAIAPYSESTVGVHSNLGRIESNYGDSDRNIAIMYASHKVLNSLMPQYAADWDQMLLSLGLDPYNQSTDLNTPVGVGNTAGNAVVTTRVQDGMNQLGTDCNIYKVRPYSDCSGYKPTNKAEKLVNPRKWQPDTLTSGGGIFFSQQFVTPQYGQTTPFSYDQPTLMAPIPTKSYAVTSDGSPLPQYRDQADEVLQSQLELTDEQKLLAEFYDNKIISLGFSTLAASIHHQLTLEQFVQLDFLVNVAAFDTGITIWDNKRHYDAVRPFSAIAYIYGSQPISAWGGPGKGNVNDMPGSDWRPYLQSANHPEYPSASASFCRAHATSTKRYLREIVGLNKKRSNDLSFWTPDLLPPEFNVLQKPAGSSVVEPGVTPAAELTLGWKTWDDFSDDCGISRLWAGVHFYDSIPAGQDIGQSIGSDAFDWLETHINGNP